MLNTFIHQNIWAKYATDDVYMINNDGIKYLDLLSGAGCYFLWKYGDKKAFEILSNSANILLSAMNFYNHDSKIRLKNFLIDLTNYPIVFFACSGSEANDAAIKLSMKYHFRKGKPKTKVLYPLGGLFGRTFGAVYCSQTSYHDFLPRNENFIGFNINDIDDFINKLDSNVGTVMLEFLPTKAVIMWDDAIISRILKICHENDVNIIVDEIKSGFGRTGRVLASHYWTEKFGIKPSMVTFGKALSAGLPMSGVLADWKFVEDIDSNWHMSTMGAQPFICDLACYLLQPLFDNKTLEKICDDGKVFHKKLVEIYPNVFHVGKWWTLLFPKKDAFSYAYKLREKNILVYCTSSNYISLLPSLYFNIEHWEIFLNKFKECINEIK